MVSRREPTDLDRVLVQGLSTPDSFILRPQSVLYNDGHIVHAQFFPDHLENAQIQKIAIV
jgi:hypothetical protein